MKKKFTKYNSIDQKRELVLGRIREYGYDQELWHVSSKIHGSNISVYIHNDGTAHYASRVELLKEEDLKRNFMKPFEKYSKDYKTIYENIVSRYRLIMQDDLILWDHYFDVVLYGEIFGGKYSHPDIPRDNNAERIQKGVDYCPQNDFLVFDIGIVKEWSGEEKESMAAQISEMREEMSNLNQNSDDISEVKKYLSLKGKSDKLQSKLENNPILLLSVHEIDHALKGTQIRTTPTLGIMPFEDAFNFDPIFQSLVPRMYGLPDIEDNFEEGIVIKTVDPKYFGNGDRAILKIKHPKFEEKAAKSRVERPPKEEIQYSEDTQKCIDEAEKYATENRLRNVLSKMNGIFNSQSFPVILNALDNDVLEEMNKEFPDDIARLHSINDYDLFRKAVSRINSKLLKEVFRSILDGSF